MKRWRTWLLAAAIVLFAALAVMYRSELERVKEILAGGEWGLFLLALALQMAFFLWQSLMYCDILGAWIHMPFWAAFRLTLASSSVNKLVPSGGVSGLVVYMRQAAEEGVASGFSLLANVWFYILDYASFLLVVWLGVVYGSRTLGLTSRERWVVVLATLVVAAALACVLWATRNAARVNDFLESHPGKMACLRSVTKKLHTFLATMSAVDNSMSRLRLRLWRAFGYGLLMQITDILILFVCFRVVHHPVGLGMVATGFGLATIFSLASMVPQGIGIYETAMAWVFIQMGIDFGTAVTVSLLYRGATFWFAMIPGIFTLRGRGGGL